MTSRWSVPWRHRTVVAVVAGCYLVVGAGVMLPTNQALEASQITRHPQPERALLEPGGLLLVEWLRLDGGNLMAAANASMWLAVAGALLLLMPLGLLLSGLYDREQKGVLGHAQRALSLLGGLTLLFGSTLLLRAVLLLLVMLVWGGLEPTLSAPARGWVLAGACSAVVLFWIVPGILQDLARAGLAGAGLPVGGAVWRALMVFAKQPARVLAGYAPPAAAALLVVALGLTLLRPGMLATLGAFGPGLGFLGHQLGLLALVAFKAVWLYHALELTSSAPSPLIDGSTSPPQVSEGDPIDPNPPV